MKQEYLGSIEQREHESVTALLPLSVELYQVGSKNRISLPGEISQNAELQRQSELRRNLHTESERIFSALSKPGQSLTTEVLANRIPEDTTTAYWNTLTDFLKEDQNHARLLLYLPFEVLPDMTELPLESPLYTAASSFADTYRSEWIRLLHESEPRANFVDGDILEPGLGEPERISKAGHVTPELLEKGIIHSDDIVTLLECIHPDFVQSLAEGTLVSRELGLIDDVNWEHANMLITHRIGDLTRATEKKAIYFDPESLHISKARAEWLKKVAQEKQDHERALDLARQYIASDNFSAEHLSAPLTAAGLMEVGNILAHEDQEQAEKFVLRVEDQLHILADHDRDARDTILSGLQQWARMEIVHTSYLDRFGTQLVDLSAVFPYDEKQLATSFSEIGEAVAALSGHPELARALYPTILLFGSKMKGYAAHDADLDAALFFRPGVPQEDREAILHVLRNQLPESLSNEKFLEFWVEERDSKLACPQPDGESRTFVGEDQIHFLLGGAWIGGGEEVEKLRVDILRNYLDIPGFGESKERRRQQLLGQLELDILQYRLMHKGYRRIYPVEERETPEHADLIDYASDFWDRGYRRVATKLYLSRVYLPDISLSG